MSSYVVKDDPFMNKMGLLLFFIYSTLLSKSGSINDSAGTCYNNGNFRIIKSCKFKNEFSKIRPYTIFKLSITICFSISKAAAAPILSPYMKNNLLSIFD